MSDNSKELFQGEELGVDIYDIDMNVDDAIGKRGDLVRDLSELHGDFRSILSYGWDFEASSGDSWWDFRVRYEGDNGHVSVSGRPDGAVDVIYRTESVAEMPDYVGDEVKFLNKLGAPEGVSQLEKGAEGLSFRLEESVDPQDQNVQRYVKDALGLYVGIDGDVNYPSREDKGLW